MSNGNRGSVSAVARGIREQLEAAQTSPTPAATQETPAQTGMVVTKDGQFIPPGAPIPTDASGNPVATSIVPDATFHGEAAL